MIGDYKIVEFDKYCPTCRWKNRSEHFSICNECLTNPARIDSHKPECYEKKEKKNASTNANS